jgi:molybdopterin converting factor subunit 1
MITVRFFAILKDRAGRDAVTLDFSSGTVSDLIDHVIREYPSLSEFVKPDRILITVNQEFVKQDTLVQDGDEVALMPPFSGGSGRFGIIRIQKEPFSLDDEVDRLKQSSSSIGGIVTFLGTTRDMS